MAMTSSAPTRRSPARPPPGQPRMLAGSGVTVLVDGGEPLDSLTANLLDGDDTITTDVALNSPTVVRAIGGAGDDTARYSGSAGDDTIGIANDGTFARVFTPTGSGLGVALEHTNIIGGDGD